MSDTMLKQEFTNMTASRKEKFWKGLLQIAIGVLFLIFGMEFSALVVQLFMIYINVVNGWRVLAKLVFRRYKDKTWKAVLIPFIISELVLTFESLANWPGYFLVILVCFYQIFMSAINGITYYFYRKDKVRPRGRYLFDCIWMGLFGIGTLFSLVEDSDFQLALVGIYLIGFGFTSVRDAIYFDHNKKNVKRRSRATLPIVFAALVPVVVLRKINETLLEQDVVDASLIYDDSKTDEATDLQVLVHVSDENFFGAMGHVDIAYKGRVIAFGNYDTASERLFGSAGDGVIFKTDKDAYIAFCQKESNKTLFEYGIRLNDEQRAGVEEQITAIDNLLVPFEPDSTPKYKNGRTGKEEPMYLYRMKQEIGADTYKFTSSKFKTYFVLSTNCVLLADSIIGRAGTDILSGTGIIAPGTYQDYLNNEYARPNSVVVSRSVHHPIQTNTAETDEKEVAA